MRAIRPPLQVFASDETLKPFETDALIMYRETPLAAALPESELQVRAVIDACRELNVPVVTRGSGTSISGGSIPHKDGVLLITTKMSALKRLDPLARMAVVEPGHRNLAVSEAAKPYGLFYAPDPSSQVIASIGGNVAENSGGIHCLKYGLTTHNVMSVRAITSEGDSIVLGGESLDAAGYDLLSVMIGSEGNLGVVTQATLKLLPLPQVTTTLLASFNSVNAAAESVGDILATGVIPAALEMMDKPVIEACERFMQAGFPTDAEALLLVELDGSDAEVAADRAVVRDVLLGKHASEVREAEDEESRAKLWRARRGAFTMLASIYPDYYTIDGTIPRKRLPEVLDRTFELAKQYELFVANVFHAGDGNIHPCIFYDASKPGDMERAEELGGKILEHCVAVGGTITGEHGVGVEKLKQMCVQFRDGEIAAFHMVKAAFDPAGIMNPGKAIPSLKRCAEWGGMHVRGGQLPMAHIPRF